MRLLVALLALALLPGCVGMQDGLVMNWTGLSRDDTKTTGDIVKAVNKGVKVAAAEIVNAPQSSAVVGDFETIGGHEQQAEATPVADKSVTVAEERPDDILVIVVCDLRQDGVPLRCYPPKQVRRDEWPGFWRANGGDLKYANGQATKKFTTHKVIKTQRVTSANDSPDDVMVLFRNGQEVHRVRRGDMRAFFLSNPDFSFDDAQVVRAKSVLVPPKDNIRIIDVPTVTTYPTSLPIQQVSYAGCPCGCNGLCGGNCGCVNCTCRQYATPLSEVYPGYRGMRGGCASCGSAGGSGGFMQGGPVRRFLSRPFRGGWFPGRGVFRLFRGCRGC